MVAVCIATIALAEMGGVNTRYDPHWTVGDSWTVRYTVKLSRGLGADQPAPVPVLVDDLYTYEVASDGVEGVRNVVRIRADHVGPRNGWLLTFDRDKLILLRVEQIVNGVPESGPPNPFTDDAWMSDYNQYFLRIIHDFPRIPLTDTDETRTVTAAVGSGAKPFAQSIDFAPGQVTADLYRTDPVTSLEHRTTIVWQAGAKWWSSATTTLGGNVEISSVLEPAPRAVKTSAPKEKPVATTQPANEKRAP